MATNEQVKDLFDEDAEESEDGKNDDGEDDDDDEEGVEFDPELVKSGFLVDENDKKAAKKRKREDQKGLLFGGSDDEDGSGSDSDDSDDDSDDSDDDSDDSDDSEEDNDGDEPKLKRLRKTEVSGGNQIDEDELALLRENREAEAMENLGPRRSRGAAGGEGGVGSEGGESGEGGVSGVGGEEESSSSGGAAAGAADAAGESSDQKKQKKKKKKKAREMDGFIVQETSSEDDSEEEDGDDENGDEGHSAEYTKQQMDMQDLFGIDDEHQVEALRRAQLRAQSSGAGDVTMGGVPGGSDLDENEEDDEENDEISVTNLIGASDKDRRNQIRAQYEPKARKDAFVDYVDEEIRVTDVPERLQVRNRAMPATEIDERMRDVEYRNEASWIKEQLERKGMAMDFRSTEGVEESIEHVLRLLKEDHLEIPFILRYRSECFQPGSLRELHLWQIYDLDITWAELRFSEIRLRKSLQALILHKKSEEEEMNIEEQEEGNGMDAVASGVVASSSSTAEGEGAHTSGGSTTTTTTTTTTGDATTGDISSSSGKNEIASLENVLSNLEARTKERGYDAKAAKYDAAYLRLEHTNLTGSLRGTATRRGRAKRMDSYERAVSTGLLPLIRMVGLEGDHLGDNVDQKKRVHALASNTPGDDGTLPFSDFLNNSYRTEDDVKKALISALARKIAAVRYVREFAERRVYEHLRVTTRPTKKGERLIDHTHEFYVVQSLNDKPLNVFLSQPTEGDLHQINAKIKWDEKLQYLLLCRAESERMVDVEYSGKQEQEFLLRLLEVGSDLSTPKDSDVNEIRASAAREAARKYAMPEATAAMREQILRESREHLVDLCGDVLWKRASLNISSNKSILPPKLLAQLKVVQDETLKQKRQKEDAGRGKKKLS